MTATVRPPPRAHRDSCSGTCPDTSPTPGTPRSSACRRVAAGRGPVRGRRRGDTAKRLAPLGSQAYRDTTS